MAPALAEVSYNHDIRPILSDKCYFCHGPDEANNKADLRLDLPERAYAALKESIGHAIVPGDPEKSALWKRIISTDPEMVMPPPDSNLSINDQERDLLRRWIEEGATYEEHWAFSLLPTSIPVPEQSDSNWPQNEVDQFIVATLQRENLKPSAEATPLRWLRRASFDLTGLPPTPEEIAHFRQAAAADPDAAKAAAADRLLGSSSYGEQMAVAWLDAARYADSYGYQSDKLNTQWPYRDWVVKAFNQNLPYDQFLTWNLAGDLLEEPTRDQVLATAFNRLHRLNNEGGAIFEEWRTENIADRVHTFGTAVLGLTMECTRCHDHKYDPITMQDYYSLFAFFNSIDENGMYDRSEKVPSPTLLLPTPTQEQALENAQKALAESEQAYQLTTSTARSRFDEWLASNPRPSIPDQIAGITFDATTDQGTWYTAEGDRGKAPSLETVEITDSPLARNLPGDAKRLAVRYDGDRGTPIKDIAPFDRWTPFSITLAYRETERDPVRSVLAHHSRGTDAGYNGWDLISDQGYIESRIYRVWPGNAIGIRATQPVPHDRWQHLTATYDGSSKAAGLKLYLDGIALETTILRDRITKSANVMVDHGGMLVVGQRFRDRGIKGGLVDELLVHHRALTPLEVRELHTPNTISAAIEAEDDALFDYYCSAIDEQTRPAASRLEAARRAVVAAEEAMHEIPVMEELADPLPAYILARGDYDAPKTEDKRVKRDTIASIPPSFPQDAPHDRLGLARWVTHPNHPLTARVFVNRIWAGFFGRGLVSTPENFGLQGALPSHPELLDWLARDFIANGWDVKRLCRQIVLSATYAQDSKLTVELREKDPENLLLSRGPAFRLSAEQIRDLALASSGLLNRKAGGPPVSPYQPGKDLWTESNGMSPPYKQSVGKALHRRSLYSVWKRTAPLPNMMSFDAGTREVCTVTRSRTNTPLQALVLLNDVQFVEAARALATRVHAESVEEEIHAAFLALTGRDPLDNELTTLGELHASELTYFSAHPAEAAKLIAHGESPVDASLEPVRLATSTSVCLAILNLDATIWKR